MKLTLGTAKIVKTADGYRVNFMRTTSFLVGEQWFASKHDAIKFCSDRGLRVLCAQSRP